jgi:predicted Zn-dependent peptidase
MVISQEISLLEDTPEELVHEIFSMEFWRDDPLGRPILGELTTIEKIDRATMLDFKERHYTSGDTVICAAGRVDHDEFVDLFGRHMSALPRYEAKPQPKSAATAYPALVAPRDLEQAHVCIGMTGPGALEDTRHAAYILSNVLGGGMSSRLFQEVREKRGLAYSVYSFVSSFSDTGLFGLYAGCDPERLEELLGVLGEELFGIADSITKEETDDAKQQMRGNIILGMESTDALMNRLAKSEFHFGRQVLLDEIIGKVENVPTEQPAELARQLLSPERCAIIALGPVEPDTDLRAMLTAKIK